MEALEHLVHHDAEALVDRRLLRDPEDARELVLERAQPVGLDVRGRQRQPVPPPRDERLERVVGPRADRLAAAGLVALGVEEVVVERGEHEHLALLGAGPLDEQLVDLGQGVGHGLALLRALDQRGQLQELEVPGHRLRHLLVRVEAHLPQPARNLADGVEQLVPHHAEGRVQPLRRTEELLLDDLVLAPDGRPRLLEERRRPRRRAAFARLGPGEDESLPRAGHRHVKQAAHLGLVDGARIAGAGQRLLDQRVRHRIRLRAPWARHA